MRRKRINNPNRPTILCPPAEPPRNVSGVGWVLVVSSILSTIFLFALDNTVTANVQPSIVAAFHRVDLLPWVSVAYLLGSAAVNLFWCVPTFYYHPYLFMAY